MFLWTKKKSRGFALSKLNSRKLKSNLGKSLTNSIKQRNILILKKITHLGLNKILHDGWLIRIDHQSSLSTEEHIYIFIFLNRGMGTKTIPLTKNSIGFSNSIGLDGRKETKNGPEDPNPILKTKLNKVRSKALLEEFPQFISFKKRKQFVSEKKDWRKSEKGSVMKLVGRWVGLLAGCH